MSDPSALLASDMDGTVIPLELTPQREAELREFREAVEGVRGLILAYVTGRGLALAEKGLGEFSLPLPDHLVCDVGTSVYRRGPRGFEVDEGYAELMRETLAGLDFHEVRRHLEPVGHLLLQPEERQTEFKLSYHLPGDRDHREVMAEVRDHLGGLGGRVQAVYSVGAPSGTGLLDLLPRGAAKDSALRYLHRLTGVDAGTVVYAGDSGNDLAALLAGYRGIVVANAGADLLEDLEARRLDGGFPGEIHFATYPYARGVLEGCRHFGIL